MLYGAINVAEMRKEGRLARRRLPPPACLLLGRGGQGREGREMPLGRERTVGELCSPPTPQPPLSVLHPRPSFAIELGYLLLIA